MVASSWWHAGGARVKIWHNKRSPEASRSGQLSLVTSGNDLGKMGCCSGDELMCFKGVIETLLEVSGIGRWRSLSSDMLAKSQFKYA